MATIQAERATWDAERTRLPGQATPLCGGRRPHLGNLGWPHRAGYAWWRHADAKLTAGQPIPAAVTAIQTAAVAADGHAPLLAQVRALAQRARIPLQPPPATSPEILHPPQVPAPYRPTEQELAVLRLLAAGRTNAQIGAELYIGPRTAGGHVTNIPRELGVSNRVQAAALAEHAGLCRDQQA